MSIIKFVDKNKKLYSTQVNFYINWILFIIQSINLYEYNFNMQKKKKMKLKYFIIRQLLIYNNFETSQV